MKINLKKLETAFPQYSASKFPFSAVSILSPLFIRFSNTASCHWLSVNKFQWKMKPSFELGTLRWLDTVFQGQYLPCVSINYVAINKDLEKLAPQFTSESLSLFKGIVSKFHIFVHNNSQHFYICQMHCQLLLLTRK